MTAKNGPRRVSWIGPGPLPRPREKASPRPNREAITHALCVLVAVMVTDRRFQCPEAWFLRSLLFGERGLPRLNLITLQHRLSPGGGVKRLRIRMVRKEVEAVRVRASRRGAEEDKK
jgi:hypothetical protein